MTASSVVSVLGEERQVEMVWPDGSYTCPFCGGAVVAGRDDGVCQNPACDAGVHATVERAQARKVERERLEAERLERERKAEAQAAAFSAFREAREAERAEWFRLADEEGVCLECLVRSNGRKRIRHRTNVHSRAS